MINLLKRHPITTYTTLGTILIAIASRIQADYASGWESLLYWSSVLFGAIAYLLFELYASIRGSFGFAIPHALLFISIAVNLVSLAIEYGWGVLRRRRYSDKREIN